MAHCIELHNLSCQTDVASPYLHHARANASIRKVDNPAVVHVGENFNFLQAGFTLQSQLAAAVSSCLAFWPAELHLMTSLQSSVLSADRTAVS